jgi:hypothetical protein
VPGGPSARCVFSPVLHVFVVFLLAFVLDPVFLEVFVAIGLRTVRASVADDPDPVRMVRLVLADNPFLPGSSLVVLLAFTDCPRLLAGPSAWPLRTVRGTWSDCPRGQCGQSAPPGRTVRQCLAALFLGSIPPSFLSCFRVCFKESFLRIEVYP